MIVFACSTKEKETATDQATTPPANSDSTGAVVPTSFRFEVIAGPDNTFGYDVYKNEALFIHQPHIPGMSGVKGFAKAEQATKAAELMIEKMNNGVVPPTLSEDEVKKIMAE